MFVLTIQPKTSLHIHYKIGRAQLGHETKRANVVRIRIRIQQYKNLILRYFAFGYMMNKIQNTCAMC